jgi:hypothetical protein
MQAIVHAGRRRLEVSFFHTLWVSICHWCRYVGGLAGPAFDNRGHTPTTTGKYTMQNPQPVLIHRDSKAWSLQVWISFSLAVFVCAVGLAYLPGKDLDRAFMVMGYFFCLTAAFVLSKFVRDNEKTHSEQRTADTPMFKLVVWGGFFLAMGLTGWGLVRMEVNDTYKAFLGVSWLYLITGTFTLAKTLRDKHEADVSEAQLRKPLNRADAE